MTDSDSATHSLLRVHVETLLERHDPLQVGREQYLRARFDAGLAWVHHPVGLGGLDLDRSYQAFVDGLCDEAGAPDNSPTKNSIGLGMAAPTILAHGTPAQRDRFLRPLWTGEELWCQLFSEPGAGSDLAGVATRAVRTVTSGSSSPLTSRTRRHSGRPLGSLWPAPKASATARTHSPTTQPAPARAP